MSKELISKLEADGFYELSNAVRESYTDLHTIEIEKMLAKEGGEKKLKNLEAALQQCPGDTEKDRREKKACLASLFKPYYELPIEVVADVCTPTDNFATIHALATFNIKRMLHIAAPREREDAFAVFVELYNSDNGAEKVEALSSTGANNLTDFVSFNELAEICKRPGFLEYGKAKGGLFNHINERLCERPYVQNDRWHGYRTVTEKLDHIYNNIRHAMKAAANSATSDIHSFYESLKRK